MHTAKLPSRKIAPIYTIRVRECYFPYGCQLKIIIFANLLDEKHCISWPSVDY